MVEAFSASSCRPPGVVVVGTLHDATLAGDLGEGHAVCPHRAPEWGEPASGGGDDGERATGDLARVEGTASMAAPYQLRVGDEMADA